MARLQQQRTGVDKFAVTSSSESDDDVDEDRDRDSAHSGSEVSDDEEDADVAASNPFSLLSNENE